jgi:hypothetical protein
MCSSISLQTDSHPDIPYQITYPLPLIFSSELCYKSSPIFLSDSLSLPNLASISQFKPSYAFAEEAEIALSEQYDRKVKEFYEDEQDCVRAARAGEPDPQPPDHQSQ